MTVTEVKQAVRIESLAVQAGYKLTRAGGSEFKLICPNPEHNDTNASCSINTANNVFQCMGCGWKGSVIDWVMGIEGCDFKEAIRKLGVDSEEYDNARQRPSQSHANKPYEPPKAKAIPEAVSRSEYKPEPKYRTARHEYKDSMGNVLYKSVRFDYPDGNKSFQLIHRNESGTDVFGMKGVTRVPYNYDTFHDINLIYFVEGEKCADAMTNALRVPCSTTCGGSKAWIKEYAEYFKDKDMVLIPDNDEAGRKFMKQVADDCCNTASSIRILDMFEEDQYESKWDIADEINENGENLDAFMDDLAERVLLTTKWVSGIQIDGADTEQLDVKLRNRYRDWQGGGIDLKVFLPVLRDRHLRPLVGGDMLIINAATGAGKTALAQNLSLFYDNSPIPWFSLELADTRMHERNIILSNEVSGDEVERVILDGGHFDTSRFDHIHVYDNALASTKYISKQIELMPLKTGRKPRLVVVDYIQLMPAKHPSMGTVQKIESNAVDLKVLAKTHNVVMCVLSQIGRKDEANLQASKGSGAIEESATMLIGLNHVDGYSDVRSLGVYKNSNGESGFTDNIGWEGRFYKFNCTAQTRITAENIRRENEEDQPMPF